MGRSNSIYPEENKNSPICMQYLKFNAITKRHSYVIPHMDECIDTIGKATVILIIDATSGYWQIKIDDVN